MRLLKKNYTVRRFKEPTFVRGYSSIPYEDIALLMDIQTLDDAIQTSEDGTKSVQRIKAFCDSEILVESSNKRQKADRVFFQNKWFECTSCRLSENTPLRHYTAQFVECPDTEVVT